VIRFSAKSFGICVCFLGFSLVLVAGYLFFTPRLYRATAQVQIDETELLAPRRSDGGFEPISFLAPFEVVYSSTILDQVARNLQLNERWSKDLKSNSGSLSAHQTRLLIRRRLDIRKFKNNPGLMGISFIASRAVQAAEVANEIARCYVNSEIMNATKYAETTWKLKPAAVVSLSDPSPSPFFPHRGKAIGIFLMAVLIGLDGLLIVYALPPTNLRRAASRVLQP